MVRRLSNFLRFFNKFQAPDHVHVRNYENSRSAKAFAERRTEFIANGSQQYRENG